MTNVLTAAPTALLWDVDGTLTDSTGLIADSLDHVYRRFYGRTLPYDERRALIGTPLRKQIRIFGEPEAFGANEQEVIEAFISFYEANRSRERILEDVIAILKEGKRRGFPTALVTSKNDEELANTLPRLDLADQIDFAVTADMVTRTKPDPEGLRLAMKQLDIAPERQADAVYIGDTVHDMQAAKGAGVRAIAVSWGAAPRVLLEAQAPFAICDTPTELRALLFSHSS